MTIKRGFLDSTYAPAGRLRVGRRVFLKMLGAASASAATGVTASTTSGCSPVFSDVEFIVIGSGAGGGPLAANLARNGHKVLLFEAGADRGETLDYEIPRFARQAQEDPAIRWDFYIKHYGDPARQAQDPKTILYEGEPSILYPRAGTLGGCTAHYAAGFVVYPRDSDWDDIAAITGDSSWSGASMRRYFEIVENCAYLPTDTPGHGFAGWLHTTAFDPVFAIGDIYNSMGDVLRDNAKVLKVVLSAAFALGEIPGAFNHDGSYNTSYLSSLQGKSDQIPPRYDQFELVSKQLYTLLRRDMNRLSPSRDSTEGVYSVPFSTRDGRRAGPREYLAATAAEYPDRLTILTNTFVTRVLFDDAKRAIGIEYIDSPHVYRADPDAIKNPDTLPRYVIKAQSDLPKLREIIISAGVFNTPQLLKLSGVGPKEELSKFGIPVVVDLPGVGTNLQDRYEVSINSTFKDDVAPRFTLASCTGVPDPCFVQWQREDGPYVLNSNYCGVLVKSTPDKTKPDIFLLGDLGNHHTYFPGDTSIINSDNHHFSWLIIKTHTNNRGGTVTLRSSNPWDQPEIVFHAFDDGTTTGGADVEDINSMIGAVKFTRRMGDIANLMIDGGFVEEVPGINVGNDDADIADFVKKWHFGHHASCSCPIGADGDPLAALDTNFRVRGTTGLRVVDASVFPKIPGFFLIAPIFMIAEKATDVILATMGEARTADSKWDWSAASP